MVRFGPKCSRRAAKTSFTTDPCRFHAGDGRRVAAPAVVLGIADDAGAHRVQFDVGRHGRQRRARTFHEHALEALLPECPFALVGAVEPLGEALLEQFHKGAHVPHPHKETLPQRLRLRLRALRAEILQPLPDRPRPTALAIDLLEQGQQGCVVRQLGGPLRHFHEDVKVIAHHAIGDDAHPAEALVEPHELDELLLFLRPEDELPIHDTGDAVVVGKWMFRRGFESWSTHGVR